MPSIILNEIDNTFPVTGQLSEEIVFVPGFAVTNENIDDNVYIAKKAPEASTPGTKWKDGDTVDTARASGDYPSLYYNQTNGKSYKCTNVEESSDEPKTTTYTWTELTGSDTIKPHAEVEPILCYSVETFVKNFGDKPYTFADGTIDLSYLMAIEYLTLGLPVAYAAFFGSVDDNSMRRKSATVDDLYNGIDAVLKLFKDPNYMYVRYLTNGAYPMYKDDYAHATKYLECAEARKDAYAVIDHENNPSKKFGELQSGVETYIKGLTANVSTRTYPSRGAMFTPWATYTIENLGEDVLTGNFILPASFAYFVCLAKSIAANNPAYLATSGIARGRCPYIKGLYVTERLSGTIANETLQGDKKVCINPITNINPYGLTIWGDNTLADNTEKGKSSMSYLHIRNLVCRVMKLLRDAATRIIFEPNTDALWVTFKGLIMPSLDAMKPDGIKTYNIIRQQAETNTEVKARIVIVPVYAVEDVKLDVVLTNDGAVELVGGNA